MKTKMLLMSAALGAASIATAMAQTVYSVNAVGYVNVTVPAGGFALLANPLNQPTNSLTAVLPDVPVNTVVFAWDKTTSAFAQATKRASSWSGASATLLSPGSGFFVKNVATTNINITFVGEVPTGTNMQVTYSPGFTLISSIVPQEGKLKTDLGFPAANSDVVYKFDTGTQSYIQKTYRSSSGAWTGGSGADAGVEPSFKVGEGFFVKSTAGGTWTRSFSVNN